MPTHRDGSEKQNLTRVGIVGAGSWGTALGNVFADAGADTTIWGRDREILDGIEARHENPRYLRGIRLHEKLRTSPDLRTLLGEADVIVCSLPTQHIRETFAPHKALLEGKLLVNTAKGIEIGTCARVSEIFSQIAPSSAYAVLSGPSFAEEVVRRLPTAVTIASSDKKAATRVQQLVSTPYFRAYTTTDVVGVELAGSLKNVIAIASGIVTGLAWGYNAQAAVINRGIAEIARAGVKQGAKPMTFLGLAGMGDLVLTCTGPLSRNRRVGVLLGEGRSLEQAQHTLGGVAEGVFTTQGALELSRRLGIEMPILNEVHSILYEGGTPQSALSALMGRDLKEEWEF